MLTSNISDYAQVREVPFKSWLVGAKAFWVRLNGGGQRGSGIVPGGLAMPQARKEERQAAVAELSQAIDGLEKRLQEASKVRGGPCDQGLAAKSRGRGGSCDVGVGCETNEAGERNGVILGLAARPSK